MHRISHLPGLRFRLIPFVLQVLLLTGLTAQAQPDPRDDPALQQIVRLCATEPGSSRFDGAWTAFPIASIDEKTITVKDYPLPTVTEVQLLNVRYGGSRPK